MHRSSFQRHSALTPLHQFRRSPSHLIVVCQPVVDSRPCPQCKEICCSLEIKEKEVEKTCFKTEQKIVCIPRVRLPWQKCCPQKSKSRTVNVLTTHKYQCKACNYVWSADPPKLSFSATEQTEIAQWTQAILLTTQTSHLSRSSHSIRRVRRSHRVRHSIRKFQNRFFPNQFLNAKAHLRSLHWKIEQVLASKALTSFDRVRGASGANGASGWV